MDAQNAFEYSPLAPDEIRLLRPYYSSDPDNQRFEIRPVSRRTYLRYTAVSYTWGDQQPTKIIRLNGMSFLVRPNLLSCLHFLSKARHEGNLGWDWIWVDAICINQQDDREKSEQVRMMEKTYSKAQMVSVWLGLAPVFQEISSSMEEPNDDQGVHLDTGPFEWESQLGYVLNRPYWSRFWVIQEFLLAKDIHYHCGNYTTNSDTLYEILTSETEIHAAYGYMRDEEFNALLDTTTTKYAATSLILARKNNRYPGPSESLYNLLIHHRRAQCKDRRDRVFALLSLVKDEEYALLSRLLPNYALTADQVVVIALAHMINHDWWEHEGIDIDSDDMFQALGLEGDRAVRKEMLGRARRFRYYDDWASLDVARTMALQEHSVPDHDSLNDVH